MRPRNSARLLYPSTPVLFLTGGPGAGKTTTAAHVADLVERPAVVSLDELYEFTLRDTTVPPSDEERRVVLEGAAHLAVTFARSGHQVVVEGVLPPHFVSLPASVLEAADVPFHIVYLHLPIHIALHRNRSREKVLSDWHVRSVHQHFSTLHPHPRIPAEDSIEDVALHVWREWCTPTPSLEVVS